MAEEALLTLAQATVLHGVTHQLRSVSRSANLPSVLAGRYEIRDVLGRGGMGVVLRAYDRVLGMEVAVKLLRPELAPERRWAERLAREVRLARQIQHPNVCRVFDFEQADGEAFLVMDLAVGTLATEMASETMRARPCEEKMALVRSIAVGLAAIHKAGIVHGDLTPHNVLRMSDGRLVLADFGMASEPIYSTTVQGGTLAYMAPEIYGGGRASFASDVWSLGVLLHEMIFGARPQWVGEIPGRRMRPPLRSMTFAERRAFKICRRLAAGSRVLRPIDAVAALRLFGRWEQAVRRARGRLSG